MDPPNSREWQRILHQRTRTFLLSDIITILEVTAYLMCVWVYETPSFISELMLMVYSNIIPTVQGIKKDKAN